MIVFPTVRRQLQEAAERQAGRATTWWRPRLSVGALLGAAGTAVALGVAILTIVLLGHHATTTRPPAARKPVAIPTRRSGTLRLLKGNGIGGVQFGETPTRVDTALVRLFGPPQGGMYERSICGFDHASYWLGLDVRPKGWRGARFFTAALVVYFKRSRFVGYGYNDSAAISRTDLQDETHLPLNSPQGRQALHGPRLTLATAGGLALGAPLAQARRLYGRALLDTTEEQGTPPNPRLGRDSIWEVDTSDGRISGGIDNVQTSRSFYGIAQRTIGAIVAGEVPNTPCH